MIEDANKAYADDVKFKKDQIFGKIRKCFYRSDINLNVKTRLFKHYILLSSIY